VIQRQFYVGRSYNAEQAIAGFFPSSKAPWWSIGTIRSPTRCRALQLEQAEHWPPRHGSTLKKLFEKARETAAKP